MHNIPSENRVCQNCRTPFVVDASDFAFYAKMDVPAPTFCPDCRLQRRLMFRNERSLYKRACALCKKRIIATFSEEKPYTVYCGRCWWSDAWDGLSFGAVYNPNKPFFEQFRELQKKIPHMNLVVSYDQLINSEYVNHAGHLKNCFLVFNASFNENAHYSRTIVNVKDSMDCTILMESELCYGSINCGKCFRTFFSEDCTSCLDVIACKHCVGCSNCIGCMNLRNKSYYIFNKPHSKEEYRGKLEELGLSSHKRLTAFLEETRRFWLTQPHRFSRGLHNVRSTGDYLYESKNARNCFESRYLEDAKYCLRITMKPAKDLYDYVEWGNGAERIYECQTVGEGVSNMRFCFGCWFPPSRNAEYSMFCLSCENVFGCVGLRKKRFCILNTQYTEEEYNALRKRIIADMNQRPYVDQKRRVFRYGEFFPYDLSLYDYNESSAMQYFSLEKTAALKNGWRWREPTPYAYDITRDAAELPDDIRDAPDSIADDIIRCASCAKAYRITEAELTLLRRFALPLPRQCFECRFRERASRMTPPRLWKRTCAKCNAAIETAYAPGRPEILYCEKCYNIEVV